MKFLTQTVLPLVAVVGIVFLVSFVSSFNSSAPNLPQPVGPSPKPKSDKPVQLVFPETAIDQLEPCEVGKTGYFDYWFYNPHDTEIQVGLQKKSCGCSNVSLGYVAPEGFQHEKFAKEFDTLAPTAAATRVLASALAGLNSIALTAAVDQEVLGFLDAKLKWHRLEMAGKIAGATVPAHSVGLLKIGFKSKDDRPVAAQRVTFEIWCRTGKGEIIPPQFEIKIGFFLPILSEPAIQTLPDFPAPNGVLEAHFGCWSSTRDHFTLKAREANNDPCFECVVTPFTEDDKTRMQRLLNNIRVRSGYLVKVRVHEKRGGRQLDLGTYQRRILLTAVEPEMNTETVRVSGQVKGGVEIESENGTGIVLFKPFPIDRGATVKTFLNADRPDCAIELDEVQPEQLQKALKVDLQQISQTAKISRWELTLRIPPDALEGNFPENGLLILKMKGEGTRRVRIPIRGSAFEGK